MTNFIKLTEKYKNGNSTPILLNAGCIKSIKISDQGKDTHVLMQDNKYYFVTESVEDIWNKLNPTWEASDPTVIEFKSDKPNDDEKFLEWIVASSTSSPAR